MERLLRTEVDEVLPVLLEDLVWERMCQIAPSQARQLQAPPKLLFGNVRLFKRCAG
jgi:hypothetical protein